MLASFPSMQESEARRILSPAVGFAPEPQGETLSLSGISPEMLKALTYGGD
jgi:hypothetical protein